MENSITFEPLANTGDYIWMIVGALICIGIIIYSFIKKYKVLPMVSGLILMILLGSTYMTWLAESKTYSITINDDNFQLAKQTIAFKRIKNVSYDERSKSPIGNMENNRERFLIIELIGEDQPIVFPEQTFQIDSIKTYLDDSYGIWKKTQNK